MLADFRAGLRRGIEALNDSQDVVTFEVDLWSRYNDTSCTLAFYKGLASIGANVPVRILDVGCGQLRTISMLVDNGLLPVTYAGIDKRLDCGVLSEAITRISSTRFTAKDYVDVDKSDLGPEGYDVLIVDIEPHGREVHVYERFKSFMKRTHLCILKHVGSLDGYGSYLADNFLRTYIKSGHVCDYYAQNDWKKEFRDVFVIMSLTPVVLDAQCQELATGTFPCYMDNKPCFLRIRY